MGNIIDDLVTEFRLQQRPLHAMFGNCYCSGYEVTAKRGEGPITDLADNEVCAEEACRFPRPLIEATVTVRHINRTATFRLFSTYIQVKGNNMMTNEDLWLRETESGVRSFDPTSRDMSTDMDGNKVLIVPVERNKTYLTHDFNAFQGSRILIKPTEMELGAAVRKIQALKEEGFTIYAAQTSTQSALVGGYKEVTLVPPVKMEDIPTS